MKHKITQKIEMTKERLKKSLDNYITDSLTDCYNHIFLNEYLLNHITLIDFSKNEIPNIVLIYIKIDNILDINIKYSNAIGNETISSLGYLLKEFQTENELLFKNTGPNFVLYCHNFDGDIKEYAGRIQNVVKKTEIFMEPISISVAIVKLSEINDSLSYEKKANQMINLGIKRTHLTRELGINSFVDETTEIERKFFGNILIVDSDELTLSIMKEYFEFNHYFVTTALDGLTALETSKKNKYDAIIVDRYSKKIDGLTLKKYINESSMNMNSLFLLTVQSKNVDIINKANLISIDFVFDKPVILDEILGVIKRETKKGERELL
ncbi:MAG: response regulator [Clostridiales bacterium]|nr:response regulator [Clostridiales bacterium]